MNKYLRIFYNYRCGGGEVRKIVVFKIDNIKDKVFQVSIVYISPYLSLDELKKHFTSPYLPYYDDNDGFLKFNVWSEDLYKYIKEFEDDDSAVLYYTMTEGIII